jgi:hypothetical protein
MMNKINPAHRRMLSRGPISVVLTAAVIAVVLLINVLFSALAYGNLWFVDLTTYQRITSSTNANGEKVKVATDYEMYTLSDGCIELLDKTFSELHVERQSKGEEDVLVELIFCDDPDNLMSKSASRYVYMTALCLQKAFPDYITVRNIDVYKNPSAVQKYKTNSFATVYPTNVIVSSGTEYRRLSLNGFFTFSDSTSTDPWAYSGEKMFCANILAVTKAEAPIACLISNHGESGYSDTFLSLLDDAGYEVMENFDLATEEIPEDCRLMICVGPKTDFAGFREIQGTDKASEIAKLDAFLDDENSLMVFFDADTPVLPNLEEYLEKWGISILRATDDVGDMENYLLRDDKAALTADGQTLVADYVDTGIAATVLADMQSLAYPSKVVFRNATAFKLSDYYKRSYVVNEQATSEFAAATTEQIKEFVYGTYGIDGVYRSAYDMFLAKDTTKPYAFGEMVEGADTATDPYKMMIMTTETNLEPGDKNGYTTVSHTSYVLACASTDFLCDELLQSNSYGNTDMLSSVLRALGSDAMAARIEQYIKPFHETEVAEGYITGAKATSQTAFLVLLPAVVLFGLGAVVIIRRKYA